MRNDFLYLPLHRHLYKRIYSTTVSERIHSLEGPDRPYVRGQAWRALESGLLYIRYKKEPFASSVWKLVRNSVSIKHISVSVRTHFYGLCGKFGLSLRDRDVIPTYL